MLRLIILLVLLWNLTVQANDQIAIFGLGGKQCGEYLSDRQKTGNKFDNTVAAQYSDWVHGFISGYNSTTSRQQVTAELPRATVIAYLDKHCRDNPLQSVIGAAECLRANYSGSKPQYCK